jgi:hypothetical protein
MTVRSCSLYLRTTESSCIAILIPMGTWNVNWKFLLTSVSYSKSDRRVSVYWTHSYRTIAIMTHMIYHAVGNDVPDACSVELKSNGTMYTSRTSMLQRPGPSPRPLLNLPGRGTSCILAWLNVESIVVYDLSILRARVSSTC